MCIENGNMTLACVWKCGIPRIDGHLNSENAEEPLEGSCTHEFSIHLQQPSTGPLLSSCPAGPMGTYIRLHIHSLPQFDVSTTWQSVTPARWCNGAFGQSHVCPYVGGSPAFGCFTCLLLGDLIPMFLDEITTFVATVLVRIPSFTSQTLISVVSGLVELPHSFYFKTPRHPPYLSIPFSGNPIMVDNHLSHQNYVVENILHFGHTHMSFC